MKLSKRTSLLILPVILTSFTLSAMALYTVLAKSVEGLENNRLEQRLGHLRTSFSAYSTFLDAYQISLMEGEAFKNFIQHDDFLYRSKVLSGNLNAAVKRFHNYNFSFVSLSIIGPDKAVLYYDEYSDDPFNSIGAAQIELAQRMYANQQLKAWEHLNKTADQAYSLIQSALSIDSRTLARPLPTQLDQTLQIIVSVTPSTFDQQLQAVEQEYATQASYLTQAASINNAELSAQVELSPGHYLLIRPDSSYLEGIKASIRNRLIWAVIASSLLTFIILQLLIRRYVTGPIASLDQQLNQVMAQERQNIDNPTSDDEVGHLGRTFYDLYDQLHKAFKASHHAALTDALTQLPNRSAFYEAALKNLAEAEAKQRPISFVYIDLDNFKFVNDKYGHEIGDELLKAVAIRLGHLLEVAKSSKNKPKPVISRLSGDEFILMLPGQNNLSAQTFADKVLNLFDKGYHFELGNFPVTASIGIATFPDDGHTLSQLISNADLAMYQAKKTGKNKFSIYSKVLAKRARKRKDIEEKLKEPEFDSELSLLYMPIINNAGKVVGCEALLRWHSATLGPVPPDEFIPIAESTGVFEKIDLWVLERAHQSFPELQELLGDDCIISINISSAELNSDHFVDQLQALNQRYQVPTHQLELEITETFAIDTEPEALRLLQNVQDLGYSIAIDDFGTGYTSLMQMVDYPVDKIKLDKALIERITQQDKHKLIGALVDLCHLQGLTVTAEGVETLDQQTLLRDAGCDFLQGYLIAKPLTLAELKDWVLNNQLRCTNSNYTTATTAPRH